MDHLAEQSVLDLVNGRLPDGAAVMAHVHLDQCGECRALVAHVIRVSDTDVVALGSAPGVDVSDDSDEPPTRAEVPSARRAAPAAVPPPIAQIDEYRLGTMLGRGGMGTVYLARDTLLDRDVALKLIARTSSESARQRFVLEARAVARIRHPNVVVVHRVGVVGEQPFIVYDLVRGRTFDELLRPLPWPKALELAVGTLRGLAAAHAQSVLHRDLKPANLMLDEQEDVVLVDFGLAKLDGEEIAGGPPSGITSSPRLTETGVAMGTPRYMAPESWRGEPATAQTDLFSFGLVFYELLSGRVPFQGTPLDQLGRRVCSEDAPPLSDHAPWVPPLLAELIDRCIRRDPAGRPASTAALLEELEALQRGRAFDAFERDRVRRVPAGNPYPGARPFGFEHQGVLYGRREELRTLVEQLRTRAFVVVAGDAGVGKSSLCLAGLMPLLMRGALGGARRWVPVPMAPGPRPLAALADALAVHVDATPEDTLRQLAIDPDPVIAKFRAGHRGGCTAHVLYVDPLDDLLACGDRDEACRFATILGKLAEPAPALRVIATLRAQSLIEVAQLPGLGTAIAPAIFLVLEPRDPIALREIVAEPARLSGRIIDEAVVQSLVGAASRGELRLGDLETRLAELWPRLPEAAAAASA
ncbi:MAG TPA: serine/threonine-protein kinase [Kofleriaceae bacterium]|nr:serine/threonine-protein kinase [Kofleriaceae bacterium]